jgi:hypothetical protein
MPGMWGNTFQALDATTDYVLGSDGKLWRETGNMSNRSQVDANVLQFQALMTTHVRAARLPLRDPDGFRAFGLARFRRVRRIRR